MKRHRKTRVRPGVTLVEVVISILVVMVLSTGALSYQYYSARDVKHAEAEATASRIALLLLESWKGVDGDSGYDPEELFGSELIISTASVGPTAPDNRMGFSFRPLGRYEVLMDDVYYYVTLSYDLAFMNIRPTILNATVAWQQDCRQVDGRLSGNEPSVEFSTFTIEY